MSKFEDRLWTELVGDHGGRLAASPGRRSEPHRRAWPVATGATVGLAAVATAVGFAIDGATSPPPAYAVTNNYDGTVTLTIRQLTARAAVNGKLTELGVHARVVPLQRDCPVALEMPARYQQPTTQPWSEVFATQGPVGSWTVVMIPSRIPVGDTLVFAPRQTTSGWQMADAIVNGRGPSCSRPRVLWGLSRAPSSVQEPPLPNGSTTSTKPTSTTPTG